MFVVVPDLKNKSFIPLHSPTGETAGKSGSDGHGAAENRSQVARQDRIIPEHFTTVCEPCQVTVHLPI